MLSMKAQVDVLCCKSVGTDLSMLEIEDFISEICGLKKEVASLEAKLRERGEDLEQVSVRVADGTEAQDSVWSVRDQRSRDTQDSELSLTLLCYTDAQDHESTDQTSDRNAGEQQMLQAPLKMCSVKLLDCRNLIESRGEETTAEEEEEEEDDVLDTLIECLEKGTNLIISCLIYDFHFGFDQFIINASCSNHAVCVQMLSMKAQVDVLCCKSVGTDLSMLEIEDFISEICGLKKEVASLEAKLRERGEDLEQVSVRVADGTEAQDSVWSVRDQRSRDTQDSELSLTLLCYTDAQDHESTDQTSDRNAGEQQMLQAPLKMCSVKLLDCRNLIESRGEETTAEEEEEEEDDEDFIPPDDKGGSSSDGETALTSKEQLKVKSFSHAKCGKTLSSKRNLTRYKRKHTEQKDFSCKRCDISFSSAEERKLHSKEHRVKKEFRCEQCGKDFFTTAQNMKAHIKTHDEKSFQCSECEKYFSTKANLEAHKRIHTGERPYKCPHCEKTYNHGSHLKKHVRVHTNERPYQCSECGKTFTESGSLKSHQRIHSEEKLYQCKHCDKRFRQKSHLKCHERMHTGEKPYLCSHCGKSFSNPTHFGFHKRVHTGEKPYHCSVCEKRFSKFDTLQSHKRIHTGERPFKCLQCDKTFARSDVLKVHQRVHTGEKPYCCSICGERFAYLGSFQTHQNKHAKEETAPESSE
ncbi:zinc finger protein 239-like [Sinocyclocheilus grahami]|uniref:zinc finger protein 239-like n=1 Tax=Sinocyclocheilus grahami TaxID=75366 RepID=UPI0007AD0A28|nr:PREDICTED: zinc finger protein 239-like [Sinocyclocheilus grahami]